MGENCIRALHQLLRLERDYMYDEQNATYSLEQFALRVIIHCKSQKSLHAYVLLCGDFGYTHRNDGISCAIWLRKLHMSSGTSKDQ